MLQRAATNAYSWWAASHIRTKQSKWLEQSLQGMYFFFRSKAKWGFDFMFFFSISKRYDD